MATTQDITSVIERLDVFEDRAGVSLEGLSATLKYDESDDTWTLEVLGEVHSRSGAGLDGAEDGGYLTLNIVAYDEDGRVIGLDTESFSKDEFFGFAVFSSTTYNLPSEPARLRVFPK